MKVGQTVYADVLFLINFSMDFLVFYICARLSGRRLYPFRSALASALGGAYGVASLFINTNGFIISICDGTACHIKGGASLLEELEKELGVPAGTTTDDGLFYVQVVRCLGCCGLAPVMVINGVTYGKLTTDKIKSRL